MPGGTLIVSRAVALFPYIKRQFEELGFQNVEITGEEKDSLNMVIGEKKPRLLVVGSGFYHAGTPFMMRQLLNLFPNLNITAVSFGEYPDDLAAWFIFYGVNSYINYWEGRDEFYYGLREVREGKSYIAPQVQMLIDQCPVWPDTSNKVTNRHLAVLVLLCRGFSFDSIGTTLHISRNTVDWHAKELRRMFHVKNRDGLVSMAWELGLVTERDMCFYGRKKEIEPAPDWAAVKQNMGRSFAKGKTSKQNTNAFF
jgi:DNA-binding NarL/FixJ family response regulator